MNRSLFWVTVGASLSGSGTAYLIDTISGTLALPHTGIILVVAGIIINCLACRAALLKAEGKPA